MRTLGAKSYTLTGSAITINDFGFTEEQINRADTATLCSTANVKYLYDGSTPTATFGLTLVADTIPAILNGTNNIPNLAFYGASGTITIILEKN